MIARRTQSNDGKNIMSARRPVRTWDKLNTGSQGYAPHFGRHGGESTLLPPTRDGDAGFDGVITLMGIPTGSCTHDAAGLSRSGKAGGTV
jgi:hypothetical protein